jgi:hypothetical protein
MASYPGAACAPPHEDGRALLASLELLGGTRWSPARHVAGSMTRPKLPTCARTANLWTAGAAVAEASHGAICAVVHFATAPPTSCPLALCPVKPARHGRAEPGTLKQWSKSRCSQMRDWRAFCAFCGGRPETRDHVPPKIFLDQPYPENLPVVGACRKCNGGASLHEEYVACLLEVTVCGTTDPAALDRAKIARIIRRKPPLASKLTSSLGEDGYSLSASDSERLSAVIAKIARALWAYETSETANAQGVTVGYASIESLSDGQFQAFQRLTPPTLLPEVGSRMFSRVLIGENGPNPPSWIEVQQGRFAYAIEIATQRVKMVIRDYLAAEVDLGSI